MKKHSLYKIIDKAVRLTGYRLTPAHVRPHPPLASQMTVEHVHAVIDEAVHGNTTRMFALYRDIILQHGHIQTELNKRKLAVLGDPLNISAVDDQPDHEETVRLLKLSVKHTDGLDMAAPVHLLDSALYPVSVCEKVFKPSKKPGLRYELEQLIPVSHELLDFTTGTLHIKEINENGHPTGQIYKPDPSRHVIHRGHLLSTPDNFGGPFRALVFWWLLSTQGRDWWSRYLERYGSGFLIGRYDQNDDDSRRILEGAFQYATTIGGLVVTRETQVEIAQANTASTGEAYEKFIAVCNREISKIILGQTLSAEAQSTGLGSGVSKAHEKVRSDYRDFDALSLASTLKNQVYDQLADINGLNTDHYQIYFGEVDTEEAEISGDLVQSLSQAGLQLTDKGIALINRRTGLEFERASAPPPNIFSASPISTDSTLLTTAASRYSRLRRERTAQAARIIREASTPEVAILLLSQELSIPQSHATSLVAQTLTAATLNTLD